MLLENKSEFKLAATIKKHYFFCIRCLSLALRQHNIEEWEVEAYL